VREYLEGSAQASEWITERLGVRRAGGSSDAEAGFRLLRLLLGLHHRHELSVPVAGQQPMFLHLGHQLRVLHVLLHLLLGPSQIAGHLVKAHLKAADAALLVFILLEGVVELGLGAAAIVALEEATGGTADSYKTQKVKSCDEVITGDGRALLEGFGDVGVHLDVLLAALHDFLIAALHLFLHPLVEGLATDGSGDVGHPRPRQTAELPHDGPDLAALVVLQGVLEDRLDGEALVIGEVIVHHGRRLHTGSEKVRRCTYAQEFPLLLDDVAEVVDGDAVEGGQVCLQLHAAEVVALLLRGVLGLPLLHRYTNEVQHAGVLGLERVLLLSLLFFPGDLITVDHFQIRYVI